MTENHTRDESRRERQIHHYRFLEALQEALVGARDLPGLYGAAVHRLAAAFQSHAVCLAMYDGVSDALTVVHQAGLRTPWNTDAFEQAVKAERSVVREGLLVVPIVHGDGASSTRCWGVLAIQRDQKDGLPFSPGARQAMRSAAERVGAELDHRYVLLLDDVLDGLLRKTKPIDVYTHTLRELRRFIRYDHSASIMTIQRGMPQITVRAEKVVEARGKKESLTDSPRRGKMLRLTPAQIRYLDGLDRPIELRRDGARYSLFGEQDGEAPGLWRALCLPGQTEGTIVCFPLVFGGQVLGILRLAARRPGGFEPLDRHMRTLERFARLLSVTLYRSELYHQSDRQLQAIKQIGRAITEPLSVEEV